MIYKEFQGLKLSALGLGCMRLPTVGGEDSAIDEAAVRDMVAYAMKNGINYYDTAWMYHDGESEIMMGKILKDYPRDSFYLATKFPTFSEETLSNVEGVFEKQLEKCGIDHFDFYLFHNVCERNIDALLDDEKYGIFSYLKKQKENGRIRHLGFSAHGNYDTLKRFLEAYGKDLEFCQLQLNYLDWSYQKAKEKVELMNEYHIPVWVMEPVRGGRLAKLAPEYEEKLEALRPKETMPGWAFRFLQSIDSVTMILSGMSNMDQLRDNIETFKEQKPLTETEMGTLSEIVEDMMTKKMLPCTGCRYCTTKCPMELNIPRFLSAYSTMLIRGDSTFDTSDWDDIPEDKWPTACIGCRSCESICPQGIKISEVMSDFADKIEK